MPFLQGLIVALRIVLYRHLRKFQLFLMKQNLVGRSRDPRVWVGKEEFVRLGMGGGGAMGGYEGPGGASS